MIQPLYDPIPEGSYPMEAAITGLKTVRAWFAAADEKFHSQLVKLDALISKLEGSFAANGELSEADATEVDEAYASIQSAA